MTFETFLALLALAAVAAWTLGPNNLMLASSGANFGVHRTLPHICGVAFGFPIMIFVVSMGLGAIIAASAALQEVMRWAGAALLLWFAWRIATARRAADQDRSRPLSFAEAAGFQWINPKAWAMAMATTAQFVTGSAVVLERLRCAFAYAIAGFWMLDRLVGARRVDQAAVVNRRKIAGFQYCDGPADRVICVLHVSG